MTTAAATPPTVTIPKPKASRLTVTQPAVRKLQTKKDDPTAHLSPAQVEAFGNELDALRDEILASRGESDAAYIRKVIDAQRKLELGSRAVLLVSIFPPAWLLGTFGLSLAKILENMEIGHNVMHGQWDWMRDPKIHSSTWDWDNATPADLWKHSHNELHHTYTNVLGKDNDLGYGIARMDRDQRWSWFFLGQPVYQVANVLLFEYGIAAYDLQIGRVLAGKGDKARFRRDLGRVGTKVRKQMTKDYLVHPLLSGPSALTTLAANVTANVARNVWTHSVIFCGHFPEGVATFEKATIEGETRGEWYLRQMLGSANIDGGPLLHLMTGNLSFQIEHHLFPDLPSNRYAEIAPRVREIAERYDLPYVSGPFPKQLASAWGKLLRYTLPNEALDTVGGVVKRVRSVVPGL